MIIIRYLNNIPHEFYHSVELCKRDYGEDVDAREVPDDHADVQTVTNRQRTEQQAEQAKRQQIRDLVQRLEEGTATSRQVQKALAHVIRKAI